MNYLPIYMLTKRYGLLVAELEGKSDNKIRVMELVEELRGKRADKQVSLLWVFAFFIGLHSFLLVQIFQYIANADFFIFWYYMRVRQKD
jgi:hypothetical protein